MRKTLGPGEFLARQSGDEFLGLQTSGNHPQDAQAFAERIAGVFSKPFRVQGQVVTLTASIGYSIFPTDTPSATSCSATQSSRCTGARASSAALICQYHREMDDIARARRALARDLQTAHRSRRAIACTTSCRPPLRTERSAAPKP